MQYLDLSSVLTHTLSTISLLPITTHKLTPCTGALRYACVGVFATLRLVAFAYGNIFVHYLNPKRENYHGYT